MYMTRKAYIELLRTLMAISLDRKFRPSFRWNLISTLHPKPQKLNPKP